MLTKLANSAKPIQAAAIQYTFMTDDLLYGSTTT
jgi:hypothetical protein